MTADIIDFPNAQPSGRKLSDPSYHAARAQAIVQEAFDPEISRLRARLYESIADVIRFIDDSQRGVQRFHNQLRIRFNAQSVETIRSEDLPAAIEFVGSVRQDARAFADFILRLRRGFCDEYLRKDEPWTGWIKRHLGRPLDANPNWRELAREIAARKTRRD